MPPSYYIDMEHVSLMARHNSTVIYDMSSTPIHAFTCVNLG
jgi:hypothetical protein